MSHPLFADRKAPNSKKSGPQMPEESPKKQMSPAVETAMIVVVAIAFAFTIQYLLVKPYKIPSPSMVPTLDVGQRVLANRIEGRFGTPERGDVMVFNPPPGAEAQQCGIQNGESFGPAPGTKYVALPSISELPDDLSGDYMPCPVATEGKQSQAFIKRVIGLPGDRLKIIKGHAYINGKELVEPYINPDDSCDDSRTTAITCTFSMEIKIPEGMYFMLGDNRNNSDDSRFWGPIPKENMIGEAFATYWPPNRIGGL